MNVSSLGFSNQFIEHVQSLQRRQLHCMQTIASGRTFQNVSDSPAVTASLLKIQGEQSQVSQYKQNLLQAKSLIDETYSSVEQLYQLNVEMGVLATQYSDLNKAALPALQNDFNNLLEQCLHVANVKHLNQYLFAGDKLSTQPFNVDRDDGQITDVSYVGSETVNTIAVGTNTSLNPVAEPDENKEILTVLKNLVALQKELNQPNLDNERIRTLSQTVNSSNENALINIMGNLSAKMISLDHLEQQNVLRNENLNDLVSDHTDADVTTFMLHLTQSQAAYQAALHTGSKVLGLSLLNFL